MKRQLWILFTLAAVLLCVPMKSAVAAGHGGQRGHGGHRGHASARITGHSHGFGRGFGGFGFNSFIDDGYDFAELYRELLRNVPYFALHPPVYYSYPVPRTYGYSPFAYPPSVMTPEIAGAVQPLEIINPYVPSTQQKADEKPADETAATKSQPEPLVILNPFVSGEKSVAQADH